MQMEFETILAGKTVGAWKKNAQALIDQLTVARIKNITKMKNPGSKQSKTQTIDHIPAIGS